MSPARYAELHCLSNFSFQRGASHAHELVERAQALGYDALAITDECSLAGIVRAHEAARKAGLKLIVGAEFRLDDGPAFVLLAPDRAAYAQISRLITRGRQTQPKGRYRLQRADCTEIDRCLALWLVDAASTADDGLWLAGRSARTWLALSLQRGADDAARLGHAQRLAAATGLRPVAVGSVLFHVAGRKPLHDVLTAVRLGCRVADAGRGLLANAEAHLRPIDELGTLYPPDWLAETAQIAARCDFDLATLRYDYPTELVPDAHTPTSWLRALTERGLQRRYPAGVPTAVQAQVERELALIAELNYEKFFLTVEEIVRWSRERDILCQGRGSAANSAVCYALGVTSVDPAQEQLLFERFISKERDEPPDIDVDFEHERREEVIQHVFARYGRDRCALAATVIGYRTRSALRDVGRALGMELDDIDRVSKTLAWWDQPDTLAERLAAQGFDPRARRLQQWLRLTRLLTGFPRHLSQHVGGFVISQGPLAELVPIENAAMPDRQVIQWDKDDLESLRLLKVDILALGMLTALRKAFALVRDFHTDDRARALDLATLPADDEPTYAMIQQARTVGVFQIESRAQQSMLPRLRPANFYDLVIQIAIVRPGPITGGMVHPYLQRRELRARGALEPEQLYPPALSRILDRTLGVPIFQEQVMQIAITAAGFTPGEADNMRRSMAAWKRSGGLEHLRDRLIGGMLANGYAREFAEPIYERILGFGSYGFPESHSASFALLAYASAFLKCHYPAAFIAALLNSQPMGFYPPSMLVAEARRSGVEVRPVDVQASDWECTLEPSAPATALSAPPERSPTARLADAHESKGTDSLEPPPLAPARGSGVIVRTDTPRSAVPSPARGRGWPEGPGEGPLSPEKPSLPPQPAGPAAPALRLGLLQVQGLDARAGAAIAAARRERAFSSPQDLARRAGLSRRDLLALANAGALESLSGHRHAARWAVAAHQPDTGLTLDLLPEDDTGLRPPTLGEDVLADYHTLGLSLRAHPLALLRPRLRARRVVTARDITHARDRSRLRVAGLVMFRQRPPTAKGVMFMTLEDETGSINLILRPRFIDNHREVVLGARIALVSGEVQATGGVIHLMVEKFEDASAWIAELPALSRDFR